HVRGPVAHGLVDRVLERARAAVHAAHLRAEEAHAADVGGLAGHVLRAHVDDALEAEERAHGGAGHAVLARARLRDHARLAHALHEQALAHRVVDLVRARVAEVLALEPEPAAEPLGQAARLRERRGPAHEVAQVGREQRAETGVAPRVRVGHLQLAQRLHEDLGHVAPAVGPEVPARVRSHRRPLTASTNARTLAASFLPGADSTPLETSTASGRTVAIASPTFSGVKPPASTRNE